MIIDELKYKILQQFGFPPTQEQAHALEVFAEFVRTSIRSLPGVREISTSFSLKEVKRTVALPV